MGFTAAFLSACWRQKQKGARSRGIRRQWAEKNLRRKRMLLRHIFFWPSELLTFPMGNKSHTLRVICAPDAFPRDWLVILWRQWRTGAAQYSRGVREPIIKTESFVENTVTDGIIYELVNARDHRFMFRGFFIQNFVFLQDFAKPESNFMRLIY
jgi:hypothetical protein